MSALGLHHGAATDVGLVRSTNQDSYLVAPPLYVVADGMGGHRGGDVASAILVEEFGRIPGEDLDPARGRNVVAAALESARHRILAHRDGGARGGAGTTAVAALLVHRDDEPFWLVANLGDSRAYLLAEGLLSQISVDHSIVQELLDAGSISAEEAARHPERHVLTRAVGGPVPVSADFFLVPARAGERVLLCSDGVSGLVSGPALAAVLTARADPRDAADAVVRAALEAGGDDNATAVVVDAVALDPEPTAPVRLEERLGGLP